MHEYVDQVIQTGYFDDPRIVYSMTPSEIQSYLDGRISRETQEIQQKKIFFGTVSAMILNSNRSKRSDKVWKWSDIFPDGEAKRSREQTPEEMKDMAKLIKSAYNGGNQ